MSKLSNKIEKLRESISEEVGSSTMDLINKLVECELLLEYNCNK